MADRPGSAGVAAVALVATVLGALHVVTGSAAILAGPNGTAAAVRSLALVVLGVISLPTAVGLLRGAPWSRHAGIVALGGIAVVQLLPLLSGATLAVPLAGILLSGTAALYLLFAPGEFGADDGGRALSEDTDPHDFVR